MLSEATCGHVTFPIIKRLNIQKKKNLAKADGLVGLSKLIPLLCQLFRKIEHNSNNKTP